MLPADWCVAQKRGLEGLKRSGQLGVKVNIVAQVAGQPEVVFEGTQRLGVGKMLYGPKLLFRVGEA